ncbi:MAG: HAD-IIIC family phosphatase [Candidatus Margulisiibacteriota bacterium]|jgi:FkbH-like protein
MEKLKVAFLSNFTIDSFLANEFEKICKSFNVPVETYTGPYNQVLQEIINESSGFNRFKPKVVFLLIDEGLFEVLDALKQKKLKIVVNNILDIDGDYKEINSQLSKISNSDIDVFDINKFCLKVGHDTLIDKKMYYLADMKISFYGLRELAKEYMYYVFKFCNLMKKCIILDLDNTLWCGIVGENEIRLNEKENKPFLDFQKELLKLNKKGIILTINSNNNFEDSIKVIGKEEMILKKDNFASIKINWNNKVENIKEIANELNIGLDSLIFIDDNKANQEMVRSFLPEVYVADMPEDNVLYSDYLRDLKFFNKNLTKEDLARTEMYLDENKRNEFKTSYKDLDSFIEDLNVEISFGENSELPRVAQLTQKTNQFNFTTKRYSEEDIKIFINNGYLIKYISVKDRFGDYGITGVIIIKKGEVWEIDTFLLSCRVLGKKIEYSFLKEIVRESAGKKIYANFNKTSKNKPAEDFLNKVFNKEGNKYILREIEKWN